MQRTRSALTPTFVPFRPDGHGWVAYHDIGPACGPAGLAMTWRAPEGGLRWVAAIDRVNDGWVTGTGQLREGWSLNEAMSDMLRGRRVPRPSPEAHELALLFPHVDSPPKGAGSNGLPPLAEHAELARRAVAEAELTPAMRDAFKACLDHGVPSDMSISPLRTKSISGEWPVLALAARHPELVRAVLKTMPMLLASKDPMAALRDRWPGMTDAHLRRLAEGRGTRDAINLPRSHQFSTLNLLFASPVDWWPTKDEWPAFEVSAFTLGAISTCCSPRVPYEPLLSASKGDWKAFAARLCRAAGMDDAKIMGHVLANKGKDCGDPVRALVQDLLVPLVASREDEDGVMSMEYAYGEENARALHGETEPRLVAAEAAGPRLLYEGKSAPGILETSRTWHERQAVMQADIRGKGGETDWPALFEGEHRDGNVGVVALKDYAALREEGASLDHCVASRLPECLSGRAHVLSVRRHAGDGTWERLSTCQVSIDRDLGRPSISVDEHRGEGNAEPPEEAVSAVRSLSEAILSGRLSLDPLALARRPGPGGGSITRMCGYDWREPEELARAVLTWEPFLPRWARGLGPDGLYDALVDQGILPTPHVTNALTMG